MIGSNLLFDTNVIIEMFKGNPVVTTSMKPLQVVNVPFALVGELYLGAYRSSNPQRHLKQTNDFLLKCNILVADGETANDYALIKTELLKKGKPIPENDIWIAAIATQHNLTLVTRDKHFNEIDGLIIENW